MQVKPQMLKARLAMRVAFMMMCAVLFAGTVMAQVNTGDNYQVYMKEGNSQVKSGATNVRFYDDHGPSEASTQYTNYWDRWYDTDKHYTYVFRPKTAGDKIKVTFKKYTAYTWDGANPQAPNYNCQSIGDFSLRINDDILRVYNSDGAVAANLIAELTGTMTEEFSFMADGAMTFEFISNGQYREEGWGAEVTAVSTMSVQAPIISRATCSNDIIITPTVPGATIYYTTGSGTTPSNPTTSSTQYTAPFEWPIGYNLTVKAIAVLDGNTSSVTTKTFVDATATSNNDRLPDITLMVPTIEAIEGTNTVRLTCPAVPTGMNETFYIAYTTDDTEPSYNNGQKVFFVTNSSYTYPTSEGITVNYSNTYEFDVTTPGTVIRAKVFAYSCSDLISNEGQPVTIHSVYVDAPSISFTTTNTTTGAGTCTFGNITDGATLYYTTDGSTPTTSSTPYNGTFNVTPGQTIKVIAHHTGEGYLDSPVVSDTYVPGGEGSSGVYSNGVVVIDDREPHTLSYYTNDSPIHSLNPRDIKITYYGNSPAGRTTMTNASENGDTPTSFSATATGVAVNVNEPGDQFIYLKTLEAANADGSGNYPYTAIPNPFQVRPKYSGTQANRTFVVTLTNSDTYDNWNHDNGSTVTISYGNTTQTINGPAANGTVNQSFTAAVGTQVTITFNANNNSWASFCRIAIAYDDNTTIFDTYQPTASGNNPRTFTIAASSGSNTANYRGFYAWRIKSLSSGLAITGKSVGGIVYADEEITFETSKEEGNEVEFEALWAQAYVTNSTSTSGLNANVGYERNFMVLGSNPGSTSSTTQWPTSSSTTYTDGANLPIYQYSSSYRYSLTQQIYTPAQIGSAGTITELAFNVRTTQNSNRTLLIYLSAKPSDYNTIPQTTNSSNQTVYRTIPINVSTDLVYSGIVNFNSTGWKTITLDTPFEYDGTSNLVVTVMDNTNSARSMVFYTFSSGGTRAAYFSNNSAVDLQQYYYYVDGTSTYNNQIRFTKAVSDLAGISVPLTMTTYNPDGTGGSTTVSLPSNSISCNADLKIENIKMNAIGTLSANGHNLVVGRGVTATTTGGMCASYVKGLNSNATSPNYKIRLESGVFDIVSMIDGYAGNESSLTVSGTPRVWLVLGSDYDRAKEKYANGSMTITDKLDVKTTVSVGRALTIGSESMMGEETFKVWVKSGKICSKYDMSSYDADYSQTLYMSTHGTDTYAGYRKLFIEGGEIAGVAGGMDHCYSSTTTHGTNKSLTVRMTNGHVRSAIYGGAAQVPAGGDKEIIVTGGVVTGWIGAGCNGTLDNEGQTYGEGFIYFGGDAISGGDGSSNLTNNVQGGVIFGAGAGRATSTTTGEMTFGTNVVIADECNVEHNVYGGGNYGYAVDHSNVYVLGGTVQGNVFGGANQKQGPVVNVNMTKGTVNGSLYGGSNTTGEISGLATINVSGGTVTNVFGGGYGEDTEMAGGTDVTISGGTINNNVYGGGALGTVTAGGTQVNVSGGTMKDVFGAGMGSTASTAQVSGQTAVNVTGGTMNNVYGGGEAGDVANGTDLASRVTINGTGVTVNQNVFGGGMEGYTTGKVVVNLFAGNIKGHLFGGALGKQGSVYVGGQKTVNVTGGRVFGNVYGGSRNANDANALTGYSATEQATTCEINISAGKIDQNLYGAGYFGHTYGSVNVYLGAEAISNAPNHTTIDDNINYTREGGLNIEGTVFAGSDWGDFTGDFGGSTVSGMSNIYVDGTGYNTTSNSTGAANYMKAGLAILGCGTSNDAGTTNRTLILRNYGTAVADNGNTANPFSNATRSLFSIQRFKEVIFDNSHILFTGQGKVNSLNVTERYGLYEDLTVYLGNGSTMITNVPSSQIKSFQSVTCPDVYAATPAFTAVAIDGLGATGSATDNKIRVNGGSYIEVKYEATGVTTPYGELKGWAHMMSSINDEEATCAYARPKQSQEAGNIIPTSEDNANDGGFVSYDGIYNQYTAAGALVSTGNQDQIRYENHTPNMTKGDSQYFRIWRYGGNRTNMELVFDAHATGTEGYRTVDVTVTLPPFRSGEHYYRFETTGEAPNRNTTTEYGSDVLTFNMAAYNVTMDSDGVHGTPANNGYMHYTNGQQLNQTAALCPGKADIDDNPNVNFGLVIMPDNTSAVQGSNYIICDASDNYLAELDKPFTCRDNTQAPSFTFRLTYSNELSSNMTWDPMKVKLVQCQMVQKVNDVGEPLYYDEQGHETTTMTDNPVLEEVITDYVTLDLVVVTSTTIAQNFTTQVYAIMDGQGHTKDTYISKIILPTYDVQTAGENSTFTVKNVTFTPRVYVDENGAPTTPPSGSNVTNIATSNNTFDRNSFGLAIAAADTYDNTNVWFSTGDGQIDVAVSPVGKEIGKESGRIEVGIDVVLFYSGLMRVQSESHMGTIDIEVEFDNYADGDANHKGTLHLIVEVYRLGAGENFYVDGVDGKDETGYGKNPDKPAATVNYIFNRCGYRPGGNIFVVNTVTVDKPETWNGARFNSVNMYRYPGVHKLSSGEYGTPESNPAFTGKLVDVTNELTMRGIVMDGMYAEATAANHTETQNLYPSDEGCNFNGQAVAPMINVAEGGRVNLKDGVVLQNNYNTTASVTTTSNPGGALSVQYGGTARMNEDAQITANINALGGGAWVDGSLIVSDNVKINNNKIGTAATSRQSNVWLTEATEEQAKANVHYKVIQVGTSSTTDEYGPLVTEGTEAAKIGVDKTDFAHTIDGFMPVVYAEDGTELGTSEDYLAAPYQANQADPGEGIIFHDADKYKLEKYTDDHYLFWISTWIQAQDHQPTASEEDGGVAWAGIGNITTANQFAWLISLINGENEQTADDFSGKTIVINNDLDLKASIWVPITNFKGTLQGNGHVIQGLNSPLSKDNMGMFGNTDGATISDVIAKVDFSGDAENVGTLIGTMKNTTLSNVEAAGNLEGKTHTKNMGGLVGKVESGTIHSSFSVNNMTTSNANTVMGGLVGTNGGNLYNSFANTTITGVANGNNKIGGLVGVNDGRVENCYAVVGSQTLPAFAHTNNGVITICYADNDNGYVTTTGEGTGVELSKHGLYGAVQPNIKHIDYMYRDNLIAANTNTYVGGEGITSYINNHIPVWNGLLSALNQWVKQDATHSNTYSQWNRPTTQTLNGDLPILAFPKDNCLGNLAAEDGKMLRYSASDAIVVENNVASQAHNGLDHLLGKVYDQKAANVYLYGSAINVTSGTGSNNLFIHEDAVLLQKEGSKAMENIKATVGITFDNSDHGQHAYDYYGNKLDYDWHFMSTPLSEASTGATYSSGTFTNSSHNNISGMSNGYFPNGLGLTTPAPEGAVMWDFYTYYEPQYHWINLKRGPGNHWHTDGGAIINYNAADNTATGATFIPGKGYMMAISQDSYLSSTGTLNNGDVTITLTNQEPQDLKYNKGWNLVGNPYQAYLDLNKVGADTYYIYDAESGVYVAYAIDGSENPVAPSRYIHPHQGFFMHSDSDNNPFTFTTAMATTTKQNGSYFRGEEQINYPLVNLFAKNQAGNRDLTVIEFNRPEIGGATKVSFMTNANFSIAAHLDNESYGLLFTPEGTEKVPVHFVATEDGTYTLDWSTYNGDFTSLLLFDNKTGVVTDMLHSDSYTFEALKDDYDSRFYITYTVTGVDEYSEGDGFFAFFDGSEWVVNGKGQLDIVDVTGRILFSKRLANEQNRVNLDNVAKGIYLMRVTDGKNTMVQKIVVR